LAGLDLSHPALQSYADDLRTLQSRFRDLTALDHGATAAAVRGGGFSDALDWYQGSAGLFADPAELDRHRAQAGRFLLRGTRWESGGGADPGTDTVSLSPLAMRVPDLADRTEGGMVAEDGLAAGPDAGTGAGPGAAGDPPRGGFGLFEDIAEALGLPGGETPAPLASPGPTSSPFASSPFASSPFASPPERPPLADAPPPPAVPHLSAGGGAFAALPEVPASVFPVFPAPPSGAQPSEWPEVSDFPALAGLDPDLPAVAPLSQNGGTPHQSPHATPPTTAAAAARPPAFRPEGPASPVTAAPVPGNKSQKDQDGVTGWDRESAASKPIQDAVDHYLGQGYALTFAVAMAAQEVRESRGNPLANAMPKENAYGLYQWHPGRRKGIKDGTGIDVETERDPNKHRDAALWELTSTPYYRVALAQMQSASTFHDAARAAAYYFEYGAGAHPGLPLDAAVRAEADERGAIAERVAEAYAERTHTTLPPALMGRSGQPVTSRKDLARDYPLSRQPPQPSQPSDQDKPWWRRALERMAPGMSAGMTLLGDATPLPLPRNDPGRQGSAPAGGHFTVDPLVVSVRNDEGREIGRQLVPIRGVTTPTPWGLG
jgi:hypothetical protein